MKRPSYRKFLIFVALALPFFPQGVLGLTVKGGGETLITGGNGAPELVDLVPLKTIFAFNATKKRGQVDGRFECLALAPVAPGIGDLTANIMYVTGTVTALERRTSRRAVMRGTARITGLGAGEDIPFEATVEEGPAGATFSLTVESLPEVVFREIVITGSIDVK